MLTALTAKEWANLRAWLSRITVAEAKKCSRNIERYFATVAKTGSHPGPNAGDRVLGKVGLSSALMAEAFKFCRAEGTRPPKPAPKFTGDCRRPDRVEGYEWDPECACCGSDVDSMHCETCGGEGVDGHDCGEDCCVCLDKSDNVPCQDCHGNGFWLLCCSSPEWCKENRIPSAVVRDRGWIKWTARLSAPALDADAYHAEDGL